MHKQQNYQLLNYNLNRIAVTPFNVRLITFGACDSCNETTHILEVVNKLILNPPTSVSHDPITIIVNAEKIQFHKFSNATLNAANTPGGKLIGNYGERKKMRQSIPICDITFAAQLAPPNDTLVVFVYLVPSWTMEEAGCVHVYQCQNAEIAKHLAFLLNACISQHVKRQARMEVNEMHSVENISSDKTVFHAPVIINNEEESPVGRYMANSSITKSYSLNNETTAKSHIGNKPVVPMRTIQKNAILIANEFRNRLATKDAILLPPVDYDTISRSRWNPKTKQEFVNRNQLNEKFSNLSMQAIVSEAPSKQTQPANEDFTNYLNAPVDDSNLTMQLLVDSGNDTKATVDTDVVSGNVTNSNDKYSKRRPIANYFPKPFTSP